jgi:hypothetical protein
MPPGCGIRAAVLVTRLGYVQTGGFAGLKLVADLDTSELSTSEAKALEATIDAALAEEPSTSRRDDRMRDDQQYQVTVARGDETTVLRAADPDVPPALAALVSVLQARAEPTRDPPR